MRFTSFDIAAPSRGFAIVMIGAVSLLNSCGGGSLQPPRLLIGLAVQPASADAVAPDGTAPFSATATFNQPPTTESQYPVQWGSSDASIATVDPDSGLATCVTTQSGLVSITASAGGTQASANLTCAPTVQLTGNCEYVCGSTRCGELTGYCSSISGNACRRVYDPGNCPLGQPAKSMGTNSCGAGIDTARPCAH